MNRYLDTAPPGDDLIELESAVDLTTALLAKFPIFRFLELENLEIEDHEYENPDFPAILKVAKVRAFGRKPAWKKEEASRETASNKPVQARFSCFCCFPCNRYYCSKFLCFCRSSCNHCSKWSLVEEIWTYGNSCVLRTAGNLLSVLHLLNPDQ